MQSAEQAFLCEQQNDYIWNDKACYAALMGDRDTALQSLARAIEMEPRLKSEAVHELDLKSLREEPEFRKIVK